MKQILLTLGITCLLGCSSSKPFEKAAKELSESDWDGVCCGYDKEWVRLEKDGYSRSVKEDEAQCISPLSETTFPKVSKVTATVMLLECMQKHGWKLEVSEWVITK